MLYNIIVWIASSILMLNPKKKRNQKKKKKLKKQNKKQKKSQQKKKMSRTIMSHIKVYQRNYQVNFDGLFNLITKFKEQERSKETEVKIKTLFQQKENEIKEKDAKIAELHKKVKISLKT